MDYTKHFKVARIATTHDGRGHYRHLLVAEDGETWSVLRQRDSLFVCGWEVGDLVSVPMVLIDQRGDRLLVPDWEEVDAEQPVWQNLSDPDSTVRRVWGHRLAHEGWPRTYGQAAKLLHDRRRQSMLVHDDLVLRFVKSGVAVYYGTIRLILFHESRRRITVRAAKRGQKATVVAVEHLNRFLPVGSTGECRDGMLWLTFPREQTRPGNVQRLVLLYWVTKRRSGTA